MELIDQGLLSKIVRAEAWLEEHKKLLKSALLAKVQVEPGKYIAYIEACTKRTPDLKGFIMKQFGPDKIFELREQAKPTNYVALHIKDSSAVDKKPTSC
jgi:hypothetical protein